MTHGYQGLRAHEGASNDPGPDGSGSANGGTVPVWPIAPQSLIVASASDRGSNSTNRLKLGAGPGRMVAFGDVHVAVEGATWQPAELVANRFGLAAVYVLLENRDSAEQLR